jgi:hypothetical protein
MFEQRFLRLSPRAGRGRSLSGAKDPGEGTLRESECAESSPHPNPLPAKSGARELTADAETMRPQGYLLLPSIGVIASFASSMPSMQLTFSATTSVPSGFLPRANTSTPQSTQS